MARPRKQTIDYFPHDADAGESKTLTVLQNKYGNDGYAFWFKLLQRLGKSKGHYYSFRDPSDWEFLLAKTHAPSPETAQKILETLVVLGAIDGELYEHKIIWCQNFVDRLADVYDRRSVPPPSRPDWRVIERNNGVSDNNNSVSDDNNPQSKLKESKLKESKQEERKDNADSATALLDIFNKKFTYAFAREPNSREQTMLDDLARELSSTGVTEKQIHDAFKEAILMNKCNIPYVRAILLDWLGIKKTGRWG